VPFAHYDQASSSWRTSQLSLLEVSTSSSPIFTKAGSMRNGRLYERPTLVQRTDDSGCSSLRLPTPTSRDWKGENQRRDTSCLPGAVKMLPTPVVTDSFGARNRTSGRTNPDSKHHDGVTLSDFIRLLPTPRSATNRSSRQALTMDGHWSAPSLEQALEIAAGTLPREYQSWDEVQGWHGESSDLPSNGGNGSLEGQLPPRLWTDD
jgi:hypothetical protein